MTDLATFATRAVVAGEQDALKDFTERWLTNRRLSEHTRTAYRRDVGMWAAWCEERGINPLQATFLDVNAWGRHLEQPNERGKVAAPATVARRMSAVSSWYDFLAKLGAVPANPAAVADRPYVDRDHSPTQGFAAEDATAMLTAAAAGDRWIGAAGLAITAVLVDMGVRVSDVCGLDVEDLGHADGHRTMQLLHMKGGKRRTRAMPPAVSKVIDAYLQHRADREQLPAEQLRGALFLNARGKRIGRHEVYRFVRRLARAAGMPNWEKISPHSFRHAWNTIARQRKADLEDRQHALGHADPRTTQRYDRNRDSLDRDPSFLVAAATSATSAG
ncbi:tyrosine-type recombinase/integrase [Micromonospora arborensis]|uniref:tyrosine-type recombinase/integrase n=1 Tax=Micromonospora arborensis TaxID=2116518 RepID=UPI0033E50D91